MTTLLSDQELKSKPALRATMARAAMSRATRRIVRYNWYAAEYAAGIAPSVEEMIDYGSIAAVAYHDEGIEFGLALDTGMKLMSQWAYNEGKGVVTTAKVMVADGDKYGHGSLASPGFRMPDYIEQEYAVIELIDWLSLEPEEIQVLTMHAEAYTFAEISESMGLSVYVTRALHKAACSKAKEALDGA